MRVGAGHLQSILVAGCEGASGERGGGRRMPAAEGWSVRQPAPDKRRADRSAGELKTTWELLLPIWDLDDRPAAMQHEATVNAMSLDNVFAYKSHFEQQSKKEGKGDGVFGKDKKLPTRRFEQGDDNCVDKLHEARFERSPMVEDSEFWEQVPIRRKETYRHLPLEQEGAEGLVNENVITRAHDRALPLRLRMFNKSNFCKKGFSSGTDVKEPAGDWEAPKSLLAVQEALCNYGDVYRMLWPLDNTPRRLSRVLVHFEYGARLNGNEKERSKLLENFCDRVMRENSGRAVREKEPLNFRQAKERWRDCVEESGLREGQERKMEEGKREEGKKPGRVTGGRSRGGGGGSGDGYHGQPAGDDSKTVRYQGNLVCFHFNNRGSDCTRKAAGDGCDNGRGGIFAHVCNYLVSPGKLCFGKHKRHEQH